MQRVTTFNIIYPGTYTDIQNKKIYFLHNIFFCPELAEWYTVPMIQTSRTVVIRNLYIQCLSSFSYFIKKFVKELTYLIKGAKLAVHAET